MGSARHYPLTVAYLGAVGAVAALAELLAR